MFCVGLGPACVFSFIVQVLAVFILFSASSKIFLVYLIFLLSLLWETVRNDCRLVEGAVTHQFEQINGFLVVPRLAPVVCLLSMCLSGPPDFTTSVFLFIFVCVGVLRPSQQRGHVEPVS